jgi:hypothetical protein
MRLGGLSLATAGLAALGALAAACGDGGEALTLEEYFQRLDAQQEEDDRRLEALEYPFAPDFASGKSEEEIVNGTRDFFEAALQIREDTLDVFNGIDPPAEAEQAHAEFSEALAAMNRLNEDLVDDLAGVVATSQLDIAQLEGPEFRAGDERLGAACRALQAIADDNNIDVDLECAEE